MITGLALKRAGDVLHSDTEEEWIRKTRMAAAETALKFQGWAAAVEQGERLIMTAAPAQAALTGSGDADWHVRGDCFAAKWVASSSTAGERPMID